MQKKATGPNPALEGTMIGPNGLLVYEPEVLNRLLKECKAFL